MLKIIFSTFFVVFIAELGDKTQIQTMLLASQAQSIWPVFIGSALALILSSLVGVLAATYLNKMINPHYLQTASGVIFIIIGILTISGIMS